MTEYEYEYYSVLKKHPNTNTNNIRVEKSSEYEYEYYSAWQILPNTNTNTNSTSTLYITQCIIYIILATHTPSPPPPPQRQTETHHQQQCCYNTTLKFSTCRVR